MTNWGGGKQGFARNRASFVEVLTTIMRVPESSCFAVWTAVAATKRRDPKTLWWLHEASTKARCQVPACLGLFCCLHSSYTSALFILLLIPCYLFVYAYLFPLFFLEP